MARGFPLSVRGCYRGGVGGGEGAEHLHRVLEGARLDAVPLDEVGEDLGVPGAGRGEMVPPRLGQHERRGPGILLVGGAGDQTALLEAAHGGGDRRLGGAVGASQLGDGDRTELVELGEQPERHGGVEGGGPADHPDQPGGVHHELGAGAGGRGGGHVCQDT